MLSFTSEYVETVGEQRPVEASSACSGLRGAISEADGNLHFLKSVISGGWLGLSTTDVQWNAPFVGQMGNWMGIQPVSHHHGYPAVPTSM